MIDRRSAAGAAKTDPYIAYTRRFFGFWSPFYDLFAWPIAFAYRRAARIASENPPDRVLDICTGTGEVARRCADRGAQVTAIDITPDMLYRAQKKLGGRGVELQLMDARHLAFEDNRFDVAVLSFALHDMPREVRLEVLREATRVARRRLVILDYEFPRWRPWRRLMVAAVASYESAYLRSYSRESLTDLLRAAGIEVTSPLRTVIPGMMSIAIVNLTDR